jgi:methylenetetrahydrofolate reductase (NADPH)
MGLYDEMEFAAAEANEASFAGPAPAPCPPIGDDDRLHEKIRRLAQGFSIEVLPRTARKIESFAAMLPAATRVFIPFLPAARFADCVPLAVRLRREGMEPVPHIAARRLTSHAELTETLARLRGEAGVTQCLVIAGDPKLPLGPFADSLALLGTGVLEASGIETIFIGGQPEGIPGIPAEKVEAALCQKLAFARASSARFRLITQFTLDVQALSRWQNRLSELGNPLPVHIGIAGPTSLTTLLKFAALTGASASLRTMRRYGARLTQLASETAPDAFVSHLANRQPVAGLHVYTFGGFSQSANWIMALERGAFSFREGKAGFDIG